VGGFDDRIGRLASAVAMRLPSAAIVDDGMQGSGQSLEERATGHVRRESLLRVVKGHSIRHPNADIRQ